MPPALPKTPLKITKSGSPNCEFPRVARTLPPAPPKRPKLAKMGGSCGYFLAFLADFCHNSQFFQKIKKNTCFPVCSVSTPQVAMSSVAHCCPPTHTRLPPSPLPEYSVETPNSPKCPNFWFGGGCEVDMLGSADPCMNAREMLPMYVRHNTDITLNLQAAEDPLQAA